MSTSPQRRFGFMLCVSCLAALTAVAAIPSISLAADGKAGVIDPTKVDADFSLQGEFVGAITSDPSKPQVVAMQIRAAGEGLYEAVQYKNGLPGKGIKPEKPIKLVGKRTNEFAVLTGNGLVVLVHPDYCVLVDPEGKRVGHLDRVQRVSPTMGAKPTKDAIVLFDGSNTDQFTVAKMTEDGLLMEGADVKPMFQDFNLHLEYLLPYMPALAGQGRGNSGVYLQRRYEVQVLDSFAMEPVFNGCGSLYRFKAPDLNMCFPPLTWQTYDIVFTSPRWAGDGTKIKNARITVWHNGVKVHDNVELPNKTGAGRPEEPVLLPIHLQDHGNPVRYRNIWIVDRGASAPAQFPVMSEAKK